VPQARGEANGRDPPSRESAGPVRLCGLRATLPGMSDDCTFRLNHRTVDLRDSDPVESLLRWLKARRLGGTKEGCADGDCGACTVVLVETGRDGAKVRRAVNSCLLPMGLMPGREVLTVEALDADGDLHPVQRALVDCAGSQCGYCTPGFVMSLYAGHLQGELDDGCFEGNLCRCTGYQPIRMAVARLREIPAQDAGLPPDGDFDGTAPARLGRFHSPDSIEQALALKSSQPGAVWIAGATDLGVELSHHRAPAPAYIALDRVAALQSIAVNDDDVLIGSGVTLRRIETELAGLFPALDQMIPWFAARQVRNRATLGGNLGTASPIGDLLPVLLALDAQILCRGPAGERQLPIDRFFLDYRKTALSDDELVSAVRLPRRAGLRSTAQKVAKRQTDDISIVAAAFALGLDDSGTVDHARLAYGGVAAVPLRARQAEDLLRGRRLDSATLADVAACLRRSFSPLDDHRASADYRRELCANLFTRFARTLIGESP